MGTMECPICGEKFDDEFVGFLDNGNLICTLIIDISLYAGNKYSETHKIGRAMWSADPSAPCSINIKSVSGTFAKQ